MIYLRALLGIAFFCFAAWLLSSHRRRFPWRVVFFGIAMQVALGWFVIKTALGKAAIQAVVDFVTKLIGMTTEGTKLVFGNLHQADFTEGGWGYPLAFVSVGLPVIIFFGALMAVLYHLGVMQVIIYCMARVMSWLMGVSGVESMAMAANVFVGQTEAPLVVRPYLAKMTSSELNALMTGGFATIAGSVLAVYMGFLGEELAPHLLAASVMSAPAALLVAKIMLPETAESTTAGKVELRFDRTADNLIEAAANGTSDGLKLWLNVIAMLIAFMGLVALVNWPLGYLGREVGWIVDDLSLGRLFGWVFAPLAWLMGIDGWGDCQIFGSLLGTKVAVNEFIAFENLSHIMPLAPGATDALAVHLQEKRTAAMAAFALCGFANFASIGIQIGGISPLVPERKPEISKLALRAMVGGAFASWMTATVAGMFL